MKWLSKWFGQESSQDPIELAQQWLGDNQASYQLKAINRVRIERQQASSWPDSPIPKPFVALQILDQRLAYLVADRPLAVDGQQ